MQAWAISLPLWWVREEKTRIRLSLAQFQLKLKARAELGNNCHWIIGQIVTQEHNVHTMGTGDKKEYLAWFQNLQENRSNFHLV